jgi:hypothetical protein
MRARACACVCVCVCMCARVCVCVCVCVPVYKQNTLFDYPFIARSFLGLLLDPECGDDMLLQNVSELLMNHIMLNL